MDVMKKEELIGLIASEAGTTKVEAKEHFDLAMKYICLALENGRIVDLYGFGKFFVIETKEKMGRNPKTGEKVLISASRKVKFAPSKILKDKVKA